MDLLPIYQRGNKEGTETEWNEDTEIIVSWILDNGLRVLDLYALSL